MANAPCSWGTIEGYGEGTPYGRMLDELRAAGYDGTELGDLGYMPREPEALRAELERRDLVMLGAYEGVRLRDPQGPEAGRERILEIARLLAATADPRAGRTPFFVLADANGSDPVRTLHAGRVTRGMSLEDDDWRTFTRNAERVAEWVEGEAGLRTVFHHHCAAYVETPDEIERFLDGTSAERVGLVFDTGHFTYGAGRPDRPDDEGGKGRLALEGLERFWGRVRYVHFKDCDPGVAARARADGWEYERAVRTGVFCELGRGSVDFPGIVRRLRDRGYDDWIVVEQDVLPGMGEPLESATRNREYLKGLGL